MAKLAGVNLAEGYSWGWFVSGGEGAAALVGVPPEEVPGQAAGLPCLNSNISNGVTLPEGLLERVNQLSTSHKKTAFALAHNTARFCGKYGVERVGFFTPTFADHVTCAKEAGRRFNSLRTGVLAERYEESICVLERMKSGRIHFHLLLVLPVDIRTGFNFEEASKGDYKSANSALRAEWAFWRSTAGKYGFGRTELLPVKSNEEGLSKYVGKYIAKHIGQRETRDKGVRLVRYSSGAKFCGTAFMFVSPRSRLWRWQVGEFAKRNDCVDTHALAVKFGRRWAHHWRAEIMNIEPPQIVVGQREVYGEKEDVTLYQVWESDRQLRAAVLARQSGSTQAEVYIAMYKPRFKVALEFGVPKWSGENLNTHEKEPDDVTVMFWDSEDRNSIRIVRQ